MKVTDGRRTSWTEERRQRHAERVRRWWASPEGQAARKRSRRRWARLRELEEAES